jgi:hypothetical protein
MEPKCRTNDLEGERAGGGEAEIAGINANGWRAPYVRPDQPLCRGGMLINGDLGIVSYVSERPVAVFWFEIGERIITRVYRLINPDKLKGVPSLDDRARDGRVPVADAMTLVC